jgi:hypothetical protein
MGEEDGKWWVVVLYFEMGGRASNRKALGSVLEP